ncbi:type IV secretion system protein [Achromobacter sp. F4_2707]|uniref:type IV secretion system protein n=1 Tax=Achromobacter sp. F4_2707 TaxID=3114286 RepID=UPI0039C70644
MKRCKLFAAGIVLSVAFITPAHASGIPTVDAATIAQLQEQLLTARDQLKNLTEQLMTAREQLAAFTQSSGFGNAVGSPDLRDQLRAALPADAQGLLDRSGNSSLNTDVSRITDDVMAPVSFQEDRANLSKRAVNIEATSKAMSQRAYDSMTRRLANVDALQDQINQTTNPKEIAELQAASRLSRRISLPNRPAFSLLHSNWMRNGICCRPGLNVSTEDGSGTTTQPTQSSKAMSEAMLCPASTQP